MYLYRKIYIYIITVHVHTKVLDVRNPLATQKRLLAKYWCSSYSCRTVQSCTHWCSVTCICDCVYVSLHLTYFNTARNHKVHTCTKFHSVHSSGTNSEMWNYTRCVCKSGKRDECENEAAPSNKPKEDQFACIHVHVHVHVYNYIYIHTHTLQRANHTAAHRWSITLSLSPCLFSSLGELSVNFDLLGLLPPQI